MVIRNYNLLKLLQMQIKGKFNTGETAVFPFLDTFKAFTEEIHARMKISDSNLVITYLDEDGDLIDISNELDWNQAREYTETLEDRTLLVEINLPLKDEANYPEAVEPKGPNEDKPLNRSDLKDLIVKESRLKQDFIESILERTTLSMESRLEQFQVDLIKSTLIETHLLLNNFLFPRSKANSNEAPSKQLNSDFSDFTCALCKRKIGGVLFKCSQCLEFTVCGQCESSQEHQHVFLKIKDRTQLKSSHESLSAKFTNVNSKQIEAERCKKIPIEFNVLNSGNVPWPSPSYLDPVPVHSNHIDAIASPVYIEINPQEEIKLKIEILFGNDAPAGEYPLAVSMKGSDSKTFGEELEIVLLLK